jgi:DNA-binding FrmR family transcriptional regulator
VKHLKVQVEGVERMLTEGEDYLAILQNTAACRGALNALNKELILSHIEHHLVESDDASEGVRDTGKEFQSIVRSFLK